MPRLAVDTDKRKLAQPVHKPGLWSAFLSEHLWCRVGGMLPCRCCWYEVGPGCHAPSSWGSLACSSSWDLKLRLEQPGQQRPTAGSCFDVPHLAWDSRQLRPRSMQHQRHPSTRSAHRGRVWAGRGCADEARAQCGPRTAGMSCRLLQMFLDASSHCAPCCGTATDQVGIVRLPVWSPRVAV